MKKYVLIALSLALLLTGAFSISAQEDSSSAADQLFVNAGGVETADDLSAYLLTVKEQDPNVLKAEASSDSLVLGYKRPSKLFGFISFNIPVTATIGAKGSVDLAYPWYEFLVTRDDTVLQSNLTVFAGRLAGSQELNPRLQATVIALARMVMKDNLEGINTMERLDSEE